MKREVFYPVIISLYISIISFVVSEIEIGVHPLYNIIENLHKNMGLSIFYITLTTLVVIVIYEYILLKIQYQKLKTLDLEEKSSLKALNINLQNKLKFFEKPLTKDIKFRRFEKIIESGIVFGYVDYEPFFYSSRREIGGIGYEVLKEIMLNIGISKLDKNTNARVWKSVLKPKSSNWKQLLKGLENKRYDMIASPIYEMRTRLFEHSITFSIPLFYSEIGLYVHRDTFKEKFNSIKVKFSNFNINNNDFFSPYIEDEISELLAKKLNFDINEINAEVYNNHESSYIELLEKVNTRESPFNIVAMEVFKAKTIIDREGLKDDKGNTLVNILEDKQLIYPVSFVTRKEDTALINFLNIRIMDIQKRMNKKVEEEEKERPSLRDIINVELNKYTAGDVSEITSYLIDTYDFKLLSK